MNHEMRRSDRAVTDPAQIRAFLEHEQILRIGFYDAGEIYIVPVNYGFLWENDRCTFYFHGAKAGRKYALALNNPEVGFEIDGAYELLPSETACRWSAKYQSVIGSGTLSVVTDADEKRIGLNAVMRQTSGKSWEFTAQQVEAVAVFRLDVSDMTCKAK